MRESLQNLIIPNFMDQIIEFQGPYLENSCTSVDALATAYKTILDVVGTTHIDVDVESSINMDQMNQALAKVQQERPSTTVSFTLMVQVMEFYDYIASFLLSSILQECFIFMGSS